MPTRRIRIVCISDTHNQTPKLPSGDLLIHAGDLTNQGSFSELEKTVKWLQQTDFQVKIIVCGNHDITCDAPFYQQHGGHFHNKRREDSQKCIDLFRVDPTFVYLNHEAKVIRLDHGDDTFTLLKVFGSPYSPANGFWAFGYKPEEAVPLWSQIPLDSDLVVAHTPAKFHRDKCGTRGAAGCQQLRETLWRVRPRLFVCGHIHEGYGVETVTWDFSTPSGQCQEKSVRQWKDAAPDSKKQYIVDLSSRSQSSTLRNDGSISNLIIEQRLEQLLLDEAEQSISNGSIMLNTTSSPKYDQPDVGTKQGLERRSGMTDEGVNNNSPSTLGQTAPGTDSYPGQEGSGKHQGRSETCIVNAAFMATNWPHKSGKKFHKPIVIDIDLPILHQSPAHHHTQALVTTHPD